jgi:hypothetical protein
LLQINIKVELEEEEEEENKEAGGYTAHHSVMPCS